MRIIHFIEFFQPQLGYQETFLAREQLEAGHDVVVVTSDRYFPFPDYDASVRSVLGARVVGAGDQLEEGIRTLRLPTTPLAGRFIWLHGLGQAVLQLRPDVVHIHTLSNVSTFRLARILSKRRVAHVIDDHMLFSAHRTDLLHQAYIKLVRLAARHLLLPHSQAYVGVAAECSRYMTDVYGIPSDLIATIPLGTDTKMFAPDCEGRRHWRKAWGLDEETTVVGYIGKVIPSKGVHEFADAIAPILQKNAGLRCVIVGDAEPRYLQRVRSSFDRFNVTAQVICRPPVRNQELPGIFNALDVCVWPRQSSMSLLDASACGRPVVCSNDQVSLERIAAGNGIAVSPGDIAALRTAIARLVEDRQLRITLGQLGRQQALQRFSWARVSASFVDRYEQALAAVRLTGSPPQQAHLPH